jgi:hypothetical protein
MNANFLKENNMIRANWTLKHVKLLCTTAAIAACLLIAPAHLLSQAPTPTPTKIEGVINDFSPSSTSPSGAYHVNGPWSLQWDPSGKAEFTASLTMVRPHPATDTEADRNFHTHHILVTDGKVEVVGTTIVVTGPALITASGNSVFAGSTVRVEITGGNTLSLSNMTLTFGGAAATHFTDQPYNGVVKVR